MASPSRIITSPLRKTEIGQEIHVHEKKFRSRLKIPSIILHHSPPHIPKFPPLVSTLSIVSSFFSVIMATGKIDDLSVSFLEDSAISTINDAKTTKKLPWDKILTPVYTFFLCWQLIAMCLYLVRAFTCFKHEVPTYICEENAAFPNSATIELCWLITRCLQIIIAVAVLPKLTDFPGFKAIMRQLKTLPQFWSLFFLLLAGLSRYAGLFVFSKPKASFFFARCPKF